MAYITDKIIYLATPKTASRSTVAALKSAFPSGEQTREHHIRANEALKWVGRGKVPWTCLRNPYTQVLSWFYHVPNKHWDRSPTGLLKFLQLYRPGWLFEGRLNVYSADLVASLNYFLFEEGVESFLERIGAANTSVPHVGNGNTDPSLLTPEVMKAIEQRFPRDIALYRNVRKRIATRNAPSFGFD